MIKFFHQKKVTYEFKDITAIKRKCYFVTLSLREISALMGTDGCFYTVISSIQVTALETISVRSHL